jgi:tRNA-splicing ligase RtcB (3'-phosphate/5'-hydroxy nucleic acid ligase)
MARVIPAGPDDARIPILVWGRTAPERAIAQLELIASQPYVVGHVAAMPDLHVAHGISVGTVFATDGVVVPSALGGDLGCGVTAIRLELARAMSARDLERILGGWISRIPVGDAVQRGKGAALPGTLMAAPLSTGSLERTRERLARRHLGTLGGGNHFVELDRDMSGAVWLLVHSGSRGMGAAVGAHHLKAAEAEGLGSVPGLPVLSDPGLACLSDIRWALDFATANRDALLASAALVVEEVTGAGVEASSRLDLHHNFVREEQHLGRTVWVHRKGAIAAPAGTPVLIPGSMGTASYIAEGLGEPTSFGSASHGAGRVMTRREARNRIPVARLEYAMRRVVHDERRASSLVEEAPAAYRNIVEVLEDEADLVTPRMRLEPLVVLKG